MSIVGHQLKILNAIYHLKKLSYVNFKKGMIYSERISLTFIGDYIPNSVYLSQLFDDEAEEVLDSYLKDLSSHMDQLVKVEREKDQQMGIIKNQLASLKNELNFYKDAVDKNGGSSIQGSRQMSPNSMVCSI